MRAIVRELGDLIMTVTEVMGPIVIIFAAALVLTGCQTAGVNVKPCGVITDSLKDVQGKTREDDRRISVHHERGRAAGCW